MKMKKTEGEREIRIDKLIPKHSVLRQTENRNTILAITN